MKTALAILIALSAVACGNPGNYQQPYYQQQPVIVQPYQPTPVIVQPSVTPLPHTVVVPETVTTTRRQTTVAPIQVQTAPAARQAQIVPAQKPAVVAPATQNLSDRAGMVRSFQTTQTPQPRAVGFGAAPAPTRPIS